MKTFKQIIAIIISPIMFPTLVVLLLLSDMCNNDPFDNFTDITHGWWLIWIFRDDVIG